MRVAYISVPPVVPLDIRFHDASSLLTVSLQVIIRLPVHIQAMSYICVPRTNVRRVSDTDGLYFKNCSNVREQTHDRFIFTDRRQTDE
jgi:hypothetical protein